VGASRADAVDQVVHVDRLGLAPSRSSLLQIGQAVSMLA
jgi:hypothetical protein